jgi:hypothetical protein
MVVSSKSVNYRLYESGAYGNKLRTWKSLGELERSRYSGRIVMRYKGMGGGSQFPRLGEQLTFDEVVAAIRDWRRLGASEDDIRFNEAAPDGALLIQGEVMRSTDYLSLFWSREKTTMRRALRNARQSYGLSALFLLRQNLYPSSMDDMEILLDEYPGAVIEFSAYGCAVGNCLHRNAVIWEVRNY